MKHDEEKRESQQVTSPPHKKTQMLLSVMAVGLVFLFGVWWFNPVHIPHNFIGTYHLLDIVLFFLVSYVIWHSILMDVLTWTIASHIKEQEKVEPAKGLRVAFITTIVPKSESIDLLHKCLPAMVKVDYPHDTWLLDEGNDPRVKDICAKYGVFHYSRAGKNEFNTANGKFTKTKGGNHNAWYEECSDGYDFVAQIDTDFVPKSNFLTRTLGYFKDPKVAFVGTPQVYGNSDKSFVAKGANEQQFLFYGAVLRGLSSIGMTILIGANHVIRVSEFQHVGHYTAHITEDLITSMKLHAHGLRSVYVPEVLAVGEGPTSWTAYFTQQLRWAYGCIDILFHHSFSQYRQMKMRFALYYFFLQQHYFSGLAMALSIVLLCLYFLFGIRAASIDLLRFIVAYSIILVVCWLMSVWMQRFDVMPTEEGEMLFAGKVVSVAAWPIWFIAFINVITGTKLHYVVTPKGDGKEHESSMAFAPHVMIGVIAGTGLVSSFFSHKSSPIMLFWALTSSVAMLSIPFIPVGIALLGVGKEKTVIFLRGQYHAFRQSRALTLYVNPVFLFAEKTLDILFLSVIVGLSALPYINRIGFYSDDWSFLGNFTLSKQQNILGYFLTATTPNTFMRPMQNVYDTILYFFFRTQPLGYQLVNTAVFALSVILLYAILRQLRFSRLVTLVVPLVFALLPNYSTDRFWYAAYQVNLSFLFFLLSLSCGLKAFSEGVKHTNLWKIGSIVSMVLSILSYEIFLPFMAVDMIIFLNPFGIIQAVKGKKELVNHGVFIAVNIIVLLYIVLFKLKTTIRFGKFNFPGDAITLFRSMFHTNFVDFTVGLPTILHDAITHLPLGTLLLGALICIAVFLYLFLSLSSRDTFPGKRTMALLAVGGICFFILGYSIFVTNNVVGFSPSGIDNRVTEAAAIGIAFFLVGVLGYISTLIGKWSIARIFFSVTVSLLCVLGFLVINTIALYWQQAYVQSTSVLTNIETRFPIMPKNTTFILGGVCPYVGPGIIFESQWDLLGALQMIYHDPTLKADIVTPRMKVTKKGIVTQIYTFKAFYPYKNLVIYNEKTGGIYNITSAAAAKAYLAAHNPHLDGECQNGSAGNGVSIL